ncbi:hypothetical protein GEMRC1_013443 [Eukaryota sp. GEM-RC1]
MIVNGILLVSSLDSSDSGVVKGKSKLPYHLAKKLAGTSSSSITTPPLAAPVRGYARLSNRLVRKSSHSSVFASNQPSSVRSASSPLKAVSSVFDGSCSVSSLKYLARNPSFSSFSSSNQSSSLRSTSPPSKVVTSVFDGSTAIFSSSNQSSSLRSISPPSKVVSSVFDGSTATFSSSIQSSSLRSISPPSKVVSSVFDGSTAIFSSSNQSSSLRSISPPSKVVSSVFDGSTATFSSSIQSSSLRSISPPSKVVSSVFDGSTAIFSVKSSFSISPLVQNVLNEAIAPNFSACIPLVGLTSSDNTCISRPVVAESMHESSRKCGVCKLGGHDRRNCPTRKSASDDAKIAEVVLSVESKQSVLDFQETVCEPKINSSISLTCLFVLNLFLGKINPIVHFLCVLIVHLLMYVVHNLEFLS